MSSSLAAGLVALLHKVRVLVCIQETHIEVGVVQETHKPRGSDSMPSPLDVRRAVVVVGVLGDVEAWGFIVGVLTNLSPALLGSRN